MKKSKKITLAAVGFEPTPPERLVPKTSALDHSATLPLTPVAAWDCTVTFLFEKIFFLYDDAEVSGFQIQISFWIPLVGLVVIGYLTTLLLHLLVKY